MSSIYDFFTTPWFPGLDTPVGHAGWAIALAFYIAGTMAWSRGWRMAVLLAASIPVFIYHVTQGGSLS